MDTVRAVLDLLKSGINITFSGKEPWQIVSITTSSVLFIVWLYDFLDRDESLSVRGKKTIFRLAKYIPQVRRKVEDELNAINKTFQEDVIKKTAHLDYIVELPDKGLERDEIIKKLHENLRINEEAWQSGLASGAVYADDSNVKDLVGEVFKLSSYTNPLHPDLFPGVCKMEAEVVKIICNLFHGDENSCGTMTTGGTESIMMACKAYRDYAKETRGIRRPEMVLPVTAHSGFDKAGLYLNIRLRHIPIDPNTCQVDIEAMKRAINRNTVMLVGSAPNFPYGTVDNIAEISELGLKYNIPVHVDSCLGGLLTVFMEKAGYPPTVTDFRLKGVTSISADTHKYGFAPKGTSVILYRDPKYRHCQYTVTTDWVGGVYGSPTVNGSRSGGNIATCWATLLYHGLNGYVDSTKDIIYTTRFIEKGLRRIKGIFIFGQPATSVVAIGSHDFDILRLSDALEKRGWSLNVLQYPSGIHICITKLHTRATIAQKFLDDVKEAVAEIMKDPSVPVEGKMALYGTAQKLPDRSIVGDITKYFLDNMYYVPKQKTVEYN
ncbi:sphingosine-1-phosphate lyase [Anthonomus grandis grandis]|uniref:sphingosine-1-phosphate lyase n=1 Tax=Anthonomus grandis grandis TaxID=2921223 RepID=UPI002166A02E|nr:sphingosine-1-phosphate lyase [Anthonomus grandis grandis]